MIAIGGLLTVSVVSVHGSGCEGSALESKPGQAWSGKV